MSLYKNCGWWKNCHCIFEFSVKSYVTNTINLSCAKILLPSVILTWHWPVGLDNGHCGCLLWSRLQIFFGCLILRLFNFHIFKCPCFFIFLLHLPEGRWGKARDFSDEVILSLLTFPPYKSVSHYSHKLSKVRSQFNVKFVADTLALEQFFPWVLRLSIIRVILPVHHTRPHLHGACVGTKGRSAANLLKAVLFRKSASIERKSSSVYPRVRRLVASLTLQMPGFDPGSVHVKFVVGKVALGQVFLLYLGFPLSVLFHHFSVLLYIYVFLSPEERTGKPWEPSKGSALSAIGDHWIENYFHFSRED